MSRNPRGTAKVTCINVSNIIQPNCPNISVPFPAVNGPVIAKVPVTLAELTLQVNLDTAITLPEPALEIKEITKNLKITQCLLVRCGGLQLPSVLFLKGFIRKNIRYANRGCSNAEGVCGDIRHCTVDIPFNCTTNVTFNGALPTAIQFNTSEKFSFFRSQNITSPGFAEKDTLLTSDMSEFNQVSQEFFHELPYCELISCRMLDYNEFINREQPQCISLPFEEREFRQIEEKLVASITLKILQNQQINLGTFTVTGSITAANPGGIPGIEVIFTMVSGSGSTPPPVTTDSNGHFSQSGFVYGRTYQARPTSTYYCFTPESCTPFDVPCELNFSATKVPDVTSIDPSSGPVTGGTIVVITGSGFTHDTTVTFSGTPAASVTVHSDTSITATVPASTNLGPVDVTVTNSCGTYIGYIYTYECSTPSIDSLTPSFGPAVGGNSITLIGSGFTGATEVLFGSDPASFVYVNDTEITATVPLSTSLQTVQVTVFVPDCGSSNGMPYTYACSTPVIADLTPSSGPAVGGNSITLIGSGFTGATAVLFGSVPATAFSVNSDTEITAIVPTSTSLQTVQVTVNLPSCGSSNEIPYTYECTTPSIASLTPSSGPAVGGNSITITGSGFTGAAEVHFGSVPATSSFYSDTHIEATTPPGTVGQVDVIVTNPCGFSPGYPYNYVPSAPFAWGENNRGQLGDGTTTNHNTPVQVNSLLDVLKIATFWSHNLALKSDHTIWSWGYNANGQLGDGTTTDRNTPVQVSGLSDAFAIACGGYHSVALKSDGTLWAWGDNYHGQLGNGTTTNSSTPVQVSGLSDVIAISCGLNHSLALKSDHTVWAWGENFSGQLGDGTTTDRHTPVQVSGLSDVIAIACGGYHSLVLKSNGTIWAWGYNSVGQLGDDNTTDRHTPVQVSGLSDVTTISSGLYHSLAIKSEGTTWAWGNNADGQLGDGTTTERHVPVQVQNLSQAIAISVGGYHSLALKSNGTIYAWGRNNEGQLGNPSNPYTNLFPVQVNNLTQATAISGGCFHSLAINCTSTT